ncbi:MAG: winged helix-turn-helix domain-containing protein, partial [Acidobacteria bacterium]|nr:winged helix-turn-helix domain-containing protein [Acidobacteriota bacterium]
ELAYRVAEALAAMLCRSEQTTSEFSSAPVASRIARFLLESAGEQTSTSSAAGLELSRQDLALVVGTSRETVTRVLGRISRSGLIALRSHRVFILKPDELRRLAG